MDRLKMHCETVRIGLDTGPAIGNITDHLKSVVDRAGITEGVLNASSQGSTGSLTTIEYEPGVVEDLKRALNRWAPPDGDYAHEEAWHDGNGHSHIQSALIGPSISIAIRNSVLTLGTWQQVVAINHDNHPRERRVEVTVIGC